eukprot:scaffold14226_cov186-Amphora_coffeaeformis.AAC.1
MDKFPAGRQSPVIFAPKQYNTILYYPQIFCLHRAYAEIAFLVAGTSHFGGKWRGEDVQNDLNQLWKGGASFVVTQNHARF